MTIYADNHPLLIKTLKERERISDEWLLNRLHHLLPALMNKYNMDMWIIVGREYNEDPISYTLLPSVIDSSRRITIFAFVKGEDDQLNRFVIHPNKQFEPFYTCYENLNGDSPFDTLRNLINTYHPQTIGINKSAHFAFCDGLSHSYYRELVDSIGEKHSSKLISSQELALDWLQLRTESELDTYKELAAITREIVKRAFSNEVISPYVTTTQDVVDWVRQYVLDLGLKTSFYPTVDIQRKGALSDRLEGTILPGDIVHLDFGIEYLGLCTDTQQLAYVLHSEEKEVPVGLADALNTANLFEDIFFYTCNHGMTGNEIFTKVMSKAKSEGIKAMLYSHPIGNHCHAAGPLIGLYDKQEPLPVRGELPVQNNTCYALEFNIRHYIPEWNQDIPIYLEESICFRENKMQYLTNRQTEFFLIENKK
ncbi:M24 family metallopeptidase [Fictibacillus nanhaiensis]|uniref:M24 family metallopeptidase n=1 Tax=Fictibacillus nanhaiensis TaxID=742169 RepID=UPI001C973762|nr:M24 family metallopeptidase [Fictibacillus nanhaiensis]MBY6035839.1 M24 family metallopeptidase [Fictibacillus nanhaiensis]